MKNILFIVSLLGALVLISSCGGGGGGETGPFTKIVFSSNRNGNTDVYSMNADGSGVRRLSTDDAFDGAPSMSGDGSLVAFESTRLGGVELFIMNGDGTGILQLTNSIGRNKDPSIDRRGDIVHFSSTRGKITFDIYRTSIDGSSVVQLTNNDFNDRHPELSPDGQSIVFSSDRDGLFRLYTMNFDGTEQRQITGGDFVVDQNPSFSPDGTQIIFGGFNRDTIFTQIYSISRQSGIVTNLTGGQDGSSPSFSIDGSLIAFSSGRTGNAQIFTMNADGSNPRNRSNNPEPDSLPSFN